MAIRKTKNNIDLCWQTQVVIYSNIVARQTYQPDTVGVDDNLLRNGTDAINVEGGGRELLWDFVSHPVDSGLGGINGSS